MQHCFSHLRMKRMHTTIELRKTTIVSLNSHYEITYYLGKLYNTRDNINWIFINGAQGYCHHLDLICKPCEFHNAWVWLLFQLKLIDYKVLRFSFHYCLRLRLKLPNLSNLASSYFYTDISFQYKDNLPKLVLLLQVWQQFLMVLNIRIIMGENHTRNPRCLEANCCIICVANPAAKWRRFTACETCN